MRTILMPLALMLSLAACSNAPQEAPKSAAAPAAPAAKPEEAAKPAEAKPEQAAAAKAELPEGACGDQSAVAKEDRLANTPRWTTASEVDNFGYDVFRGDKEEGPFTKLNADPILGAGTTDETKNYSYRDDTIDPCREYWYYVESIDTKGMREKFTPVFKAGAKRRAAGTAPAPTPAPQAS
ncbi:MAG: hypothetical protein BGP24_18570 [Lysobacterales bacterium 69-70]|nr:hypothetical protein [Xanthomonadaceae bacterium]ODU32800.1 MAG: hypothetical protein ABS97_14880 [Xanthomonadaceae bacterium SCN 69-320]ODV15935.1 MAG: hypothetical protein ABT27_21350 [Xanthomonadaceae bacterium SCN 69-25]OJY99930.1 MAG: hypothetical protein BGP24_18570 [Xanthomonadales bacterium 69-70]